MAPPSHITPPIEAPEPMRELRGWLVWRLEKNPDEIKPRKVPYYADGGRRFGQQGSPADRAKLTTFAAARDAAARRGFDGVGFALLPDWGITALDFDKCVSPSGEVPKEITDAIGLSYCEYSPSGEGIRAFVWGDLGNHKSIANNGQYGVETFSSSGFCTVTGNVLPHVELLDLENTLGGVTEAAKALCFQRFGATTKTADTDDFMAGREPRLGLSLEQVEGLLDSLDPDMTRDEWIRVGMAVHHETESSYDGFALWDQWSAQGGKYPGEEALQSQWDSFTRRQGPGQRQVTMASVIKMAKEAASGPASVSALEAKAKEVKEQFAGLPAITGIHTPQGFSGKFPVITAGEIARRPPGDWFIKGLLPKAELVVLYGASGSGKTFVALSLAAAIARGNDWRGLRTRKARVLYIAAEGGTGVGKRVEAYAKHHDINASDLEIGIITVPPNLMQKDDISELVASITASGGVDIIIVDTYAQTTPGANENSGEDMGLALANCRSLTAATGAMVLLVHHSGKDASRGARGWSGLRAAADAQLEVVRHDNGTRELKIDKMKDGDDGLSWGFKLEIIDIGIDRDGDPITSCVVIEAEVPVPEAKGAAQKKERGPRYGAAERHVLEMVEVEYAGAPRAPYTQFVEKCASELPEPGPGKRDTRRYTVQRAIKNLTRKEDGALALDGGYVIFCIE